LIVLICFVCWHCTAASRVLLTPHFGADCVYGFDRELQSQWWH